MLRHVAPAGAPIEVMDLARWVRLGLSGSDAADSLRAAISSQFDVRHSFLTSTGRAGLTVLLKAMRRLVAADRDEVLVPSYTCYSVAASVVKAGLRPRIVDIELDSLDFRHDELEATNFEHVLAIVATNLYGLPNDMPALQRLARDRGVFLIDDAAQAMGASIGGRPSGSWGDAGLFSFDKGKNVSAIDGGVVVTNSEDVADAFRQELAGLSHQTSVASAVHIMKALLYSVMLRPTLYSVPASIPQLGLGKTVFTTDYPLALPDRTLVALALTMMQRLGDFTRHRVANATLLRERLAGLGCVHAITPRAGSHPVYLRLPVLFDTAASRNGAIAALNAVGIGATGSYPASLADVPELRGSLANRHVDAENGRHVASCIATLPTHPFVTATDIDRTVTAIADQTAGVGQARDILTPAQS